jgi:hypothetical protein
MEDRPPIWRVAANILNKQSRTADKGWFSSLEVGRDAKTPHGKNVSCYVSFAFVSAKCIAVLVRFGTGYFRYVTTPFTPQNLLVHILHSLHEF